MILYQWAQRHGVPLAAIRELEALLGVIDRPDINVVPGQSEGAVQSLVRLEAANKGVYLWRNNVGGGTLEDGSFVRWGLANDSSQVNAKLKSGDLIGRHIRKPRGQGRRVAILGYRSRSRAT
jgi:hypothetical protein